MTFTTVVFGTLSVTAPNTATYTDVNSISTGGLILYIRPIINVGGSGIGIGFTYINQFGTTKTTTINTAISSSTTAGSHIPVVLEPGDTGIRDIISISYFAGGTAGDQLSFESWNEGLGAPPFGLILTDPHNRNIPGSYMPEPYPFDFNGNFFDLSITMPEFYNSNPVIPIPIDISISNITEFLSPEIVDRGLSAIEENVSRTTNIIEWIPEISGRDVTGIELYIFRSWLESVVGQVLSGYIQNISGEVIRNAFSLILTSPPTDTYPSGITAVADVNPNTGLYQAFLKNVIYNKRYIIVKVGIKNIALEGAGIPTVVNGNQQLPLPYNLQFACPIKNCDFTVARKII